MKHLLLTEIITNIIYGASGHAKASLTDEQYELKIGILVKIIVVLTAYIYITKKYNNK